MPRDHMIIPSEKAIETHKQEKEMRISCNEGEEALKDWLTLTLRTAGDSNSQTTTPRSRKLFICNYCRRKFLNSQALGGHQNAHRRERGTTARRYMSPRKMKMMDSSCSAPIGQSFGVQSHGLVDMKARDRRFTLANPETVSGVGWAAYTLEDSMDLIWPGSFQLLPQRPEPSPSELANIDLNLKL